LSRAAAGSTLHLLVDPNKAEFELMRDW